MINIITCIILTCIILTCTCIYVHVDEVVKAIVIGQSCSLLSSLLLFLTSLDGKCKYM